MASHLGKHSRRLHVEPLEERRMLAVATVDTELDVVDFTDGVTSLREAIFATNTVAGADVIEIDVSLSGATIDLSQILGELSITDSLTIDAGNLAGGLTIDAGDGTDDTFATGDGIRIFNIDDGDNGSNLDVMMVGLTLTGGDSDDRIGGAIRTLENLSLTASKISGNSILESWFVAEGGGIYIRYGNLSLTDSSISENTAQGEFLVLLMTAQRMSPCVSVYQRNPGFRWAPSVYWQRRSQ